jgi:hypothetical protein
MKITKSQLKQMVQEVIEESKDWGEMKQGVGAQYLFKNSNHVYNTKTGTIALNWNPKPGWLPVDGMVVVNEISESHAFLEYVDKSKGNQQFAISLSLLKREATFASIKASGAEFMKNFEAQKQ